VFFLASSCSADFAEVSVSELQRQWIESKQHSSESWWYAGESNDFYFIVKRRPFRMERFKIAKKHIVISGIKKNEGNANDRTEWQNLKRDQLVFKRSGPF